MRQDAESVTKCYIMNDEYFMKEALIEAKLALAKGEIPVGCVIVKDNKIIARAHNLKENKQSVSAHAEILAINKASSILNNYHLDDCVLYSTLEPCVMCLGAIMQSHIQKVCYALNDTNMGSCGSVVNLLEYNFQNPKITLVKGPFEEEEKELLKEFFNTLRNKKN